MTDRSVPADRHRFQNMWHLRVLGDIDICFLRAVLQMGWVDRLQWLDIGIVHKAESALDVIRLIASTAGPGVLRRLDVSVEGSPDDIQMDCIEPLLGFCELRELYLRPAFDYAGFPALTVADVCRIACAWSSLEHLVLDIRCPASSLLVFAKGCPMLVSLAVGIFVDEELGRMSADIGLPQSRSLESLTMSGYFDYREVVLCAFAKRVFPQASQTIVRLEEVERIGEDIDYSDRFDEEDISMEVDEE
ncbi:hypothetical protein BD626DRAFT_152009 [Schizophyllum amplum]|uniref:F-box domain-containing protein n=1 Tax=Schizophyllum amplum TaxID=97359 RepID=A0A550C4C8_9AGAR|nr:hypothetical protein BD626DRAFT_152009 [Auriculariopsis ampla]